MTPGEAIREAHEAVAKSGIPHELQVVAFQEVLRHCLGGSPQASASPGAPVGGPASPEGTAVGLARLVSKTGVSESALADLFDIDGDVTLHVASSRIDATKTKATGQIALLVAAARQGSGIDESWTATSHIRDILKQYNRFDSGNFSSYLHKVDEWFNFRGKAAAQEIRLTKPGWEAAIELIRSLAS